MLKIMDKLRKSVKTNKKIIIFLLGLSLIGFIAGAIFIVLISKSDQALVGNYIKGFTNNINNNNLSYLDAFKNTVLTNLIFITIIWLLGISVIGIPIIIFMYFIKSFVLGFSFSAFILTYQSKGIILAILYIFPHHIINIVIYTVLMVYAIKFSLLLFNLMFYKKEVNLRSVMNHYIMIFLVSFLIIFLTSIMETFLTPFLLNKFSFLIK